MNRMFLLALALTLSSLAGCAYQSRTVPTQRLAYSSGQGVARPAPPEPVSPRAVALVEVAVPRDGVSMGMVYFDFDEYVIKPEFLPMLNDVSKAMREQPKTHVRLEGHTDRHGSTEYNVALGQRRAEAVRKFMLQNGVPESQLDAVSFGKEKPAATEATTEADARNRRTEIKAFR